jgi:hypothetical protein
MVDPVQISLNQELDNSGGAGGDRFRFVVDGHVHFYTAEAAIAQAMSACGRLVSRAIDGRRQPVMPVLLVLDTARFSVFSTMYQSAPDSGVDGVIKAPDGYGLLLLDSGEIVGMLVGGVQIAVREGFEVLGIGCDIPIRDQQAVEEVIAEILGQNCLAVLPWAFGKWFGARGRGILELLEGERGASIVLGDNALRPAPTPWPRQFRLANEMGKPVLPGSDPLPLDDDDRRIGSYGFEFEGYLSSDAPVSSFLRELRQLGGQPGTIGRRLGWLDALLIQLKLRIATPGAALPPAT